MGELFDGSTLRTTATPALLHQEPATDIRACVCHSAPLDGGRGLGPSMQESSGTHQPRCPLSKLELDSSDIHRVGAVGHFFASDSLASTAAEVGADCHFGFGSGGDAGGGGGGRGSGVGRGLRLEVLQRVRLADVTLSSVFGSPWLVETQSVTDAEEADAVRAVAEQLHSSGEALLCRCVLRERFEDERSLPVNMRSLLAPTFLLLPQEPAGSPLLLKCVSTASQQLPRASMRTDGAPKQAQTRAAQLLGAVDVKSDFNPLVNCCTSGGAEVRPRAAVDAPRLARRAH